MVKMATIRITGFLFVGLLYIALSSASKIVPATGETVKDEYLVVLKTGLATSIIDRVARSTAFNGGHIQQKYEIGKNTIFRVRGSMLTMEKLALDNGIRVIQPNQLASIDEPVEELEVSLKENVAKSGAAQMAPCNEDYGGPDAWGIIRTSSRTMPDYDTDPYRWGSYKDDGTGVDVYILDTGIRTSHEDFQPNRAEWGFTASGTATREDPLTDINGHGTHVAGTAAGNKFGIARNAHLIAVKVSPGAWSDSIEGLEWIVNTVDQKKRQGKTTRSVVNMSLGTWGPAYALETAIQATIDAGVLVVTSAGNRANDTCTHTPQRMASIFSVGATDVDDTLAYFSNYGPCTDIMAPGRNIMGPTNQNDTEYVLKSGTSMACPHVVGTIARYLSVLPDSKAAMMTPELIKAKVINSATRGAIDLQTLEHQSTPDRFLYKVCEDGMDDGPMTTTTPATSISTSTSNPTTTQPPSTSISGPVSASSSWTMEDIHGMAAGSLSLSAITLCGSFLSMTYLYWATKQKRA